VAAGGIPEPRHTQRRVLRGRSTQSRLSLSSLMRIRVPQDAFLRATTESELRVLANLVVQAALRRGSLDNTTCVLLKIKWGDHRDEPHGVGELQSP
jgi:hypothetical protein